MLTRCNATSATTPLHCKLTIVQKSQTKACFGSLLGLAMEYGVLWSNTMTRKEFIPSPTEIGEDNMTTSCFTKSSSIRKVLNNPKYMAN